MEPVETITKQGYKAEIIPDQDPEGPDAWGDEAIFLIHYHRDFHVDHDAVILEDDLRRWYQSEAIEQEETYWIFAVTALIHSGVWLKLGHRSFAMDSQGWDTSHVGAVLVRKEEFSTEDKAKGAAESLVEEWNQYLSGDVYGIVVTGPDGEDSDSCWGFYGLDYARTEATNMIDNSIESARKDHLAQLKTWVRNRVPLSARTALVNCSLL